MIHECVISLPACGGYGLPTAYFLLQGGGVIVQHQLTQLRRGIPGRIFSMLVVAAPVFWLFHPPFVSSRHYSVHESDRCIMKTALQIAADLQLSILLASALTPRVLDWPKNLAVLHPFLRKLFWVYDAFIVMTIIAFAVLTFSHADAMVAGEPVARSLCFFIAIFWAVRLLVQLAIFDARPFLTNWFYKIGYHSLTLIFAMVVAIYGWAAIFPEPKFSR